MWPLVIWICIAVLGIVLYSIPSYLEGFDVPTIDANRESALADLQNLLNSTPNFVNELPDTAPLYQPNISKSLPDTVPSQVSPSNALNQGAAFQSIQDLSGAKKKPDSTQPDTNHIHRSKPQMFHAPTPNSDALKQGKAFQSAQDPSGITTQQSTQPPVCPTPACPTPVCPTPVCPKCPACKNIPKPCPNMQQYIRKDSIPCWGCKL